MRTENLSRPNQTPVDGDQIKRTYDNGMTETIYFWTPVEPPTPEPILKNILTPLEFLNRFTDVEAKAIIRQTKSNEDIELWWLKYNKAQEMNLNDPQTIAGVQALESFGLIGAGRAAQILTKYPVS